MAFAAIDLRSDARRLFGELRKRNLLLLAVGMILEPLPGLVMFVPTLLLHPPVGLLVFVTSAVGRVPLWDVAREVPPFLAWSLVVLALICIFPALVTFLPRTLA